MTNAMLRQISSLACANEFWLGGSWDTESPRQWSWTDGRRFSYKNWASGQPVNQEYYCIALDASGGRWYSRACRTAKPYICKVPPVGGVAATTATPFSCPVCPTNSCTSRSRAYSTSTVQSSTTSTSSAPPINGRCRDGWTYVAATGGKCLRITDSSDTWSNTWAKCKRLGGNLVSIPDDATNNALRDYAYIREGLDAKTSSWFAIGIYKPTTGGPWQWTDGTPVTYTNWQEGEYDSPMINITFLGVYGQIADNSDLYNGRWEGINEAAAAQFQGICQSDWL
ncbi:macrophage mannose receptor 1-like protein 1-like protein [Aphelenchoides avenae]|nr:macrophage mannose receptor 1-like protein 1-like protein [Aphelenchus avenae]